MFFFLSILVDLINDRLCVKLSFVSSDKTTVINTIGSTALAHAGTFFIIHNFD